MSLSPRMTTGFTRTFPSGDEEEDEDDSSGQDAKRSEEQAKGSQQGSKPKSDPEKESSFTWLHGGSILLMIGIPLLGYRLVRHSRHKSSLVIRLPGSSIFSIHRLGYIASRTPSGHNTPISDTLIEHYGPKVPVAITFVMAFFPLLRWGVPFSVLILALAYAYQLRQQPSNELTQRPLKAPTTHCYKTIQTLDPSLPSAQCFIITDGHFSHIWTPKPEELSEIGVTDGHVIPGLWDGHGHLRQYGEFLGGVDLFGAKDFGEVRGRIKKWLGENPGAGGEERWVRGIGWDQNVYGRMPTAADLEDDDLKGLHILLDRIDVHCTWASQAVLDVIPKPIPDEVPGGEIIRDPGMGVFCDNAMELVLPLLPKTPIEVQAQEVRTAMAALNQVGIVGMHDAGETPRNIELYRKMSTEDEGWTVRVYGMMECEKRNTFCPQEAATVAGEGDFLSVKSVKLFSDGALGSWGSAMLTPYSDLPASTGSLLINASTITLLTTQWSTAGYQVNIHAIGDLANRLAIDAFSTALHALCPDYSFLTPLQRSSSPNCDRRFRIEHSQIIHPDDQARLESLPILPSIQPTHATSDMSYALSRLGPERLASSAYRMKSLLRPGSSHPSFVLGSDFPVEPTNPFHGMYAATARKNPNTGKGAPGEEEKGWHTEEALSLEEALKGFTLGPAYGGFMDGKAGVIKEGAFGDWVVLDEPLEGLDLEKLRTLTVKETWVAGNKVYSRS